MTGASQSTNPIEVFFSYAHEDEKMREQLEKHLSSLKYEGVISDWNDRQISAGEEWEGEINEHINSANIILLLVSADFLASKYCYAVEMKRAMERHEARKARVIPIILRPCDWQKALFGELQALPTNARPVTRWRNRDEAFLSIAEGIRTVAEQPYADIDESLPLPLDQYSRGGPQLRLPIADFIGRKEEIERLVSSLSQAAEAGAASAVCVRGMGGVGKSELAFKVTQRVKSRFPDGQLLIEMRGASPNSLPPTQALQSVIRVFDRSSKIPDDITGTQAMYQSVLSGKRILIVADDAEDAEQVRPLLPPAGCGLLITSRQRFALPGMVTVDLNTLPADAAEQLLLEICPRLGEAAPRLAQLCDYLPLALRVSASVLSSDDTLRVERYLERLTNERDRLNLLHDPDDAALDVGASLRLSYDALTSPAQDALCQMSVFPASFDLRAALDIVLPSEAADVEQLLSLLRRRSLVQWEEEEQRYYLHDLVRVFAATRLINVDAVRQRHALYFGRLVTSAKQTMDMDSADNETNDDSVDSLGHDAVADAWNLFSIESANIDAGLQWTREHTGESEADALLLDFVNMSDDLYDLPLDQDVIDAALVVLRRKGDRDAEVSLLGRAGDFYLITNSTESIKYYEQALQIARELNDQSSEGNFLISMGMTYWMLKETQREVECLEKALAISRGSGNRWLEGSALTNIGNVNAGIDARSLYTLLRSTTISTGSIAEVRDAHQAIEHYEQALRIWREIKSMKAEAATLEYLGNTHERMGEATKAIEYYEQGLLVLRQSGGEESGMRSVLRSLGAMHYDQGNYTEAQPYYEQLLDMTRGRSERGLEGDVLLKLSDIARQRGNPREALAYNEQALPIARELGNRPAEGEVLTMLGDVSAELGEANQAFGYYEQALPIVRELGNRQAEADVLCSLGDISTGLGEANQTVGCYEQALPIIREFGDRQREAKLLTALGDSSVQLGENNQALAYHGQALAIVQELGNPDWTEDLLSRLGMEYFDLDRDDEALAAYQEAISLGSTSPTAWVAYSGLGLLHLTSGRHNDALEAYQRALELCTVTSDQAALTVIQADLLRVLGRSEEALAAYRRASHMDPSYGHEGLGKSYYSVGRYDEALAEYQQAHEIDPENSEPVLGLALVHRKLNHEIEFDRYVALARGLIAQESEYDQAALAAVCGAADESLNLLKAALSKGISTAWVRCNPNFDFIRDDPRFAALLVE